MIELVLLKSELERIDTLDILSFLPDHPLHHATGFHHRFLGLSWQESDPVDL